MMWRGCWYSMLYWACQRLFFFSPHLNIHTPVCMY
jgi:hypothetical protein